MAMTMIRMDKFVAMSALYNMIAPRNISAVFFEACGRPSHSDVQGHVSGGRASRRNLQTLDPNPNLGPVTLNPSWVVISGVISKATTLVTLIKGTYNPTYNYP